MEILQMLPMTMADSGSINIHTEKLFYNIEVTICMNFTIRHVHITGSNICFVFKQHFSNCIGLDCTKHGVSLTEMYLYLRKVTHSFVCILYFLNVVLITYGTCQHIQF